MGIDFFAEAYKTERPRNEVSFGICDDGQKAYTTVVGAPAGWGAAVKNGRGEALQFVPVDHNIVVRENGDEKKSCDGMLYRTDGQFLAFIELKDVKGEWKKEAREQLAATINLFCESHDYKSFYKRFAYAVNRQHPRYASSKKIEMQQFNDKYHFRLRYMRDIDIDAN